MPYTEILKNYESIEKAIAFYLIKNNETLSLAESCTGGLMAHRLTNISGSSAFFIFSGVTYSNESKIKCLGVSSETIEKFGAVDEQTAREMAEGARCIGDSTYGLSTTGIAGPTGGTIEKPVGTICIGLSTPTRNIGRRLLLPSLGRLKNKEAFVMAALKLLLTEIAIV